MNLPNLVQRTIHPELDALRDLQVPGQHHDQPESTRSNSTSIPKSKGWHGFRRSRRISTETETDSGHPSPLGYFRYARFLSGDAEEEARREALDKLSSLI